MPKKIYISGKITGIENQAPALFEAAENYLTSLGYQVINPMKLPHNHGKTWAEYMREDIKALCDCDAIYFLKNWIDSNGACIEFWLADDLHIEKFYQDAEFDLFKPMQQIK